MKVLVCGGVKTSNIVVGLKKKFENKGVEFIVVNDIEKIEEIYGKGEYFDRALVCEQGVTQDGLLKEDEEKLRTRVCSFAVSTSMHNDNGSECVFLTADMNIAEMIHEELLPLRNSSIVVVSAPPYSIGFFSNLIVNDLEKIDKNLVYKPVTEVEVGELDIFSSNTKESESKKLENKEEYTFVEDNKSLLGFMSAGYDDNESNGLELVGEEYKATQPKKVESVEVKEPKSIEEEEEALLVVEDEEENGVEEEVELSAEEGEDASDEEDYALGEIPSYKNKAIAFEFENKFSGNTNDEEELLVVEEYETEELEVEADDEEEMLIVEDDDLEVEEDSFEVEEDEPVDAGEVPEYKESEPREADEECLGEEVEDFEDEDYTDEFDGETYEEESDEQAFEEESDGEAFEEDESSVDEENADEFETGAGEVPDYKESDESAFDDIDEPEELEIEQDDFEAEQLEEDDEQLDEDAEPEGLENRLFDVEIDVDGAGEVPDYSLVGTLGIGAAILDDSEDLEVEIDGDYELEVELDGNDGDLESVSDDFEDSFDDLEDSNEGFGDSSEGFGDSSEDSEVEADDELESAFDEDEELEIEVDADDYDLEVANDNLEDAYDELEDSLENGFDEEDEFSSSIENMKGANKKMGKENVKSNGDKRKATGSGNGASVNIDGSRFKKTLDVFAKRGTMFVVTGPSGAGVSMNGFNLANTISRLGYKTLVIDCDTYNRSMSYMTKEVYDSIDVTFNGLKEAINGNNISDFVTIVRPNLHVLVDGIAADTYEFDREIHKDRLTSFAVKLKQSYQFILFVMHGGLATNFCSEITYMSDDIIYIMDASQYGITKALLELCNIEDDAMQKQMFQKSNLLFNQYDKFNTLYGNHINSVNDIPRVMDRYLNELVGDAAEELRFRDMKVVGYVPDLDLYADKGMFTGGCWSDSKQGRETYLSILKSIIYKE